MTYLKTLCASAALTLMAIPAFAWDNTNTGPGPNQIVDGGPGSQANATGGAGGTGYGGAGGAGYGYGGNGYATGGTSHSHATGGNAQGGNSASSQTVNIGGSGNGNVEAPAPDLVLGSVAGGTNGCLGGIGFGGAGRPGGGLFSYTWEMHDCRMRQTGQMLWNVGYHAEALRVWCKISEVREAFKGTPQQCPADGPVPAPAPVQRVVTYAPDWCYTASPGERRQHEECASLVR